MFKQKKKITNAELKSQVYDSWKYLHDLTDFVHDLNKRINALEESNKNK